MCTLCSDLVAIKSRSHCEVVAETLFVRQIGGGVSDGNENDRGHKSQGEMHTINAFIPAVEALCCSVLSEFYELITFTDILFYSTALGVV